MMRDGFDAADADKSDACSLELIAGSAATSKRTA